MKVWFAVGFKTGTAKISCNYFGRYPTRHSAKSQLSDPTPADTAGRHGRTALPTIATDPNKPFEWIFVLFIWHKWHPESHGARTTPQRGMEEKILQTLTPIYLVEVKNLYSYRYLGNNGVFHSLRQNTSKDFLRVFPAKKRLDRVEILVVWSSPLLVPKLSLAAQELFDLILQGFLVWTVGSGLHPLLKCGHLSKWYSTLIYLYLVVKPDHVHGQFHIL